MVHTLHGHLYHLAGLDLLLIGAAQTQQLLIDFFPQGLLHRFTGQISHPGRADVAGKPHRYRENGDPCGEQQVIGRDAAPVQPREQPADDSDHGDVGCQGAPL